MLTTPDHDDAVTSPPAMDPVGPKPQGFYVDCDEAVGRAGTRPRAEDFNEAILNLRELLDAASVGGVKGDPDMLHTSLARLFAGRVTRLVATTPLTPDHAGLVLVDATSGNLTLTLPAAAALAAGSPTLQFVRLDGTANSVRIVPAGTDVIRTGIAYLVAGAPLVLRSDAVNTWHPLQVAQVIAVPVTLNVAPTGTATPKDPLAGDAFDTLPRALAFLNAFVLRATVTIQVAAGTYTHTAPITMQSPYTSRIVINGAGTGTTTLQFTGVSGFHLNSDLGGLQNLLIKGSGAAGTKGLWARGITCSSAALTVTNFGSYGVEIENGLFYVTGAVTVSDCGDSGVRLSSGSILSVGTTLAASGNGGIGNVYVGNGCTLVADEINTSAGARGLYVTCGVVTARRVRVASATVPAEAVRVLDAGLLQAPGTAIPGDWWAATGGTYDTFRADHYGLMKAGVAFTTANRANASPTVNLVGNVQAYIEAT